MLWGGHGGVAENVGTTSLKLLLCLMLCQGTIRQNKMLCSNCPQPCPPNPENLHTWVRARVTSLDWLSNKPLEPKPPQTSSKHKKFTWVLCPTSTRAFTRNDGISLDGLGVPRELHSLVHTLFLRPEKAASKTRRRNQSTNAECAARKLVGPGTFGDSIHPSINLTASRSVCLSSCLSTSPSLYRNCLSVCLSISNLHVSMYLYLLTDFQASNCSACIQCSTDMNIYNTIWIINVHRYHVLVP